MSLDFALPESIKDDPIEVLDVSELLIDILRENEIETLGDLYRRVQDKTILKIAGIKDRRNDRLSEALRIRAVISRSNALAFFMQRGQWLYYLTVVSILLIVLAATVQDGFNRDEFAVVIAAVVGMLAYDAGRWVSRPNSSTFPLLAYHLRTLVVCITIPLTLVIATNNPWGPQEWWRVLGCAFTLAIISGLTTLGYQRVFALHPKNPIPFKQSAGDFFRSLQPPVQAAIVTGLLSLITATMTLAGTLVHEIVVGRNAAKEAQAAVSKPAAAQQSSQITPQAVN